MATSGKVAAATRKTGPAARTPMRELLGVGQSVWLDYLRRDMTRSGELAKLVGEGLRGMTSNPTIFEHAIAKTSDYDDVLGDRSRANLSDAELFESIALQDVREAADRFRPVYDETSGADGFVSIEVSPRLARDTGGSTAEARRLWREANRPNVMVKIPGTPEGWPAIEQCLREGININITLLFSVEHYEAVADAYLNALEARLAEGEPIDRLASVASMFVSRVDTEVDKRIESQGGELAALQGQVAIANARLVYDAFLRRRRESRWRTLEARGARLQRPLWASTGTKNPAYSDVKYVEGLIGPDSITTMPPETLAVFEDHGVVATTLPGDVESAHRIMDALARGGIDYADVNRVLEQEGIDKFASSLDKLLQVIGEKRQKLGGRSE